MLEQFPFVTDGHRGDVPINFYVSVDPTTKWVLKSCPGLSELCQLQGCTEVRGIYPWNGYLWTVARRGSQSVLWKVSSNGSAAEMGNFSTTWSGPVWMTHNPYQLLIVDGQTGYVYTEENGLVQITDPDFVGAAAAAYQDGYGLFIRPDSTLWFHSNLWDFTTYDGAAVYSKQSKPDKLVSILSFKRQPWLFGEETTEVWYNAGGDDSSPENMAFMPDSGGRLEYGCAAAASVSDLCGEAPIWLTDKRQLRMAVGYSAVVVNNRMFESVVSKMSKVDDAIAFSFRMDGSLFYQITFPTEDQTWVWDLTTKTMHRRTSWKSGGGYGRHRANCYAFLDGVHYVGDYSNGKIYRMSLDYYDDDGQPINRVLYTTETVGGLNRLFFRAVQLVVEYGVGTTTLDPKVALQISNDGGYTWSDEIWRTVGKSGETRKRAIWYRLGSGYRRMYKFTMTDPVLWRVYGVDWGIDDASARVSTAPKRQS